MKAKTFKRLPLAHAVALASTTACLVSTAAVAQEADAEPKAEVVMLEEVLVTGSHREARIQDIPLNISALGAEKIEDLRLTDVAKLGRYVPGFVVVDRGPRNGFPDVLVRGLNTTGLGPGFEDSRTVASYFGELPVDVDIKAVDMERIEFLIGPQGTLYGQGTMGGAIRYIPKEADTDQFNGELRGDISQVNESSSVGYEAGFTLNVPLVPGLVGLRANLDYFSDPGFIDYPFVVREPGISNPEPDFSNPDDVAANLRRVNDANGEETLAGRVNLHLTPTDNIESNLWFYLQDSETEGRQISHNISFPEAGLYESGLRYEEPSDYKTELFAFDTKVDLGFAEATLVYGKSVYDQVGQRDQSDLLIDFEFGYESFPSFSAFTREEDKLESETYELRLVSQHDGPLNWIVGAFDNTLTQDAESLEFTPFFDEFLIAGGASGALREDNIEYIQLTDLKEDETAFFGELTYEILDGFSATMGYRRYKFTVDSTGGFGLPLSTTVFGNGDEFANTPPEDFVEVGTNSGTNSGDLYKFNLSLDVLQDSLVYFTFSQGYRNGGVNAVPPCTDDQLNSPGDDQKLCAQQDEVLINPDTIDNFEVGFKGSLFDDSLSLNSAVYYIDWRDIQVSTVTEFGNLPITGNGGAARSQGLEFQANWLVTESLEVATTYAYTDAKLTEVADGIVGPASAPSGERLPGHGEHQGSLNVTYSQPIFGGIDMDLNYGLTFVTDFFNIIGGDENQLFTVEDDGTINPADRGGEAVPGYELHHIGASFTKDAFKVQLYVDNLLDEYAISAPRSTRRQLDNGGAGPGRQVGLFTLRSYGQYVIEPRKIGMNFVYSF